MCSVPSAHRLYVDGSLLDDRSAAYAVYSSNVQPPREDRWAGRRLPNSSNFTYCKLHGLDFFFLTLKGHWLREKQIKYKKIIPLIARSCKEDSRRNIDIGGEV